jgi:hypothetical protein
LQHREVIINTRALYSYCIRVDDGAAPNPFWGVCTLVICKPAIRRVAKIGDWVVGTGSVNSPIGDISGKVVYAMQVTRKLTMEEYDAHAKQHLPNKIPKWFNRDVRLRLGDAIYDFSTHPPALRQSVHGEENRERDLSGRYALLSNHFFYFGNEPRQLQGSLINIVKRGPGHRSRSNAPYIEAFLSWLDSLGLEPNHLYGNPQYKLFKDDFVDIHDIH